MTPPSSPSPLSSPPRRRTLWRVGLVLVGGLVLGLFIVGGVLTQPFVGSESGCPTTAPEPRRLRAQVELLAGTLGARSGTDLLNLDRAASHIALELGRAGGRVVEQPYEVGGIPYRNVIAHYGPEAGERVVVGAHYDAWGGLPGADDNASGVAGLIELAYLLKAHPPAGPVELVAFALEEPPYFLTDQMGSAVHAKRLQEKGIRVRAMFSLEMIGYFSDEPGSQRFPLPGLGLLYPDRGNFIAVVGKLGQEGLVRKVKRAMRSATDLPVHSINAPRAVPGVDFSDHASFWDAGYPAVMITDTAFYRNDRYHTARDTPDSLDYDRMAKVVQGVHCAVQRLAAGR